MPVLDDWAHAGTAACPCPHLLLLSNSSTVSPVLFRGGGEEEKECFATPTPTPPRTLPKRRTARVKARAFALALPLAFTYALALSKPRERFARSAEALLWGFVEYSREEVDRINCQYQFLLLLRRVRHPKCSRGPRENEKLSRSRVKLSQLQRLRAPSHRKIMLLFRTRALLRPDAESQERAQLQRSECSVCEWHVVACGVCRGVRGRGGRGTRDVRRQRT